MSPSVIRSLHRLAVVAAITRVSLAVGASPAIVLVGGLAVFGIVFALNSAVHSYLVLDYIDGDKVMMESLLAFKRAGADNILSYFALRAARALTS